MFSWLNLVLGVFLLFSQVSDIRIPLNYDEAGFAHITAQIIYQRRLPYINIFDQKPPAVYFPFWLSEKILGYGWSNLRLIGLVYGLITMVILYLALAESLSPVAATFGVLLVSMTIHSPLIEGQYNLMTEQQLLLPFCLWLWWLGKKSTYTSYTSCLLAGLIISWTTLIRPPYLLLIIPSLFRLPFQAGNKFFKSLIVFLSGVCLPWICFVSVYYFAGGLFWFWQDVIIYPLTFYLQDPNRFSWIQFGFWFWHKYYLFILIITLATLFHYSSLLRLLGPARRIVLGVVSILTLTLWIIRNAGDRYFAHYLIPVTFCLALLVNIFLFRRSRLLFPRLTLLVGTLGLVFFLTRFHWPSIPDQISDLPLIDQYRLQTWVPTNLPSVSVLLTGRTTPFYYLFRLPVVGGQYIAELPFKPGHELYMKQFINLTTVSPPKLIVLDIESELNNNRNFIDILNNYEVASESPSLKLYSLKSK